VYSVGRALPSGHAARLTTRALRAAGSGLRCAVRGANLHAQGASDACGEELTRDDARVPTGDSCEIDRA
jgi:hypothetical protein